MALKKEEVIQAALKLEDDGIKFYLEAAAKSSNKLARTAFESLADDEKKHIEWIKRVTGVDFDTKDENKKIYERLRGIFADVSQNEKDKIAASEDDIKALKIAVTMEEKSQAAYSQWANEGKSKPLRALCHKLAGVEAFHRQIIVNTIEYLQNPGNWFMQEEKWMFDGG